MVNKFKMAKHSHNGSDTKNTDTIPLDELDYLKISNICLQVQLLQEQLTSQLKTKVDERDRVLLSICNGYIPDGFSMDNYRIDLDKRVLIYITPPMPVVEEVVPQVPHE